MLAIDASKYTIQPTPVAQWQANGVELAIVQAHPADYGQERSIQIVYDCINTGLVWDAYIYQYLAYTDWLPAALETLDQLAGQGLLPRKLFLDIEDVDSGKSWSPAQRIDAVTRDLGLCDAWLMRNGLMPNTAIYSAAWYWGPYMANTLQFADRQLWTAQYDNVADASVFTPFGGWGECRIKQYAGSQPDGTDLDVLSVAEEAEFRGSGGEVTDEERQQMQNKIDGLVNALGYIGGDVLKPLTRKTAAAYVKTAVSQIRGVCDQQGISHA